MTLLILTNCSLPNSPLYFLSLLTLHFTFQKHGILFSLPQFCFSSCLEHALLLFILLVSTPMASDHSHKESEGWAQCSYGVFMSRPIHLTHLRNVHTHTCFTPLSVKVYMYYVYYIHIYMYHIISCNMYTCVYINIISY